MFLKLLSCMKYSTPKLRGQLAEFLNNPSPVGLRILSSSTCVGLRYGRLIYTSQLFSPLSISDFSTDVRSLSPRSTNAGVQISQCVPVLKYFGGVLLGTGGLVRAYTKSAQLGLEAAGINQMSRYSVLLITCPYSLLGVVQNILPEHDCVVEETDYAADVTLTVAAPSSGRTYGN